MNIVGLLNLTEPDFLIIFLIVLLLFGARKFPELMKGLGRAIEEFTKAKEELEGEGTDPAEPETKSARPLRCFLSRFHGGYAGAVAAPFPLFR